MATERNDGGGHTAGLSRDPRGFSRRKLLAGMGVAVGRYLEGRHPAGSSPRAAVLVTGPDESGWGPILDAGLADQKPFRRSDRTSASTNSPKRAPKVARCSGHIGAYRTKVRRIRSTRLAQRSSSTSPRSWA